MGATVAAALIAGAAGLGGSAMASRSQGKATDRAVEAQTRATDQSLAYERENEERRRYEWETTEAENARRWQTEVDREQRNLETERQRQARLDAEEMRRFQLREPYREAGRAAVADLAARNERSMRDIGPVGRI